MKLFSFLISHLKSETDSIDTVSRLSHTILPPNCFTKTFMSLDWAYLEDWCRRLTGSFKDVYVFTVPLYLPRQEADGKWRVVSRCSNNP